MAATTETVAKPWVLGDDSGGGARRLRRLSTFAENLLISMSVRVFQRKLLQPSVSLLTIGAGTALIFGKKPASTTSIVVDHRCRNRPNLWKVNQCSSLKTLKVDFAYMLAPNCLGFNVKMGDSTPEELATTTIGSSREY